jgi:hypothetical protein
MPQKGTKGTVTFAALRIFAFSALKGHFNAETEEDRRENCFLSFHTARV